MESELEVSSLMESKLQRLQLSEELERALEDEFGKLDKDPLLSSKFDINHYINSMFGDEDSLKSIDTQIQSFDDQIFDLDIQIKECIREQAYASENAREELKKINEDSAFLIDRIQSVKEKAEISEEMVKSICSEIRSLDFAKKNITFTITSLKRMIMLITGIEQLRGFCINKQYREAANLIEATDELCNYFKDYKDIPQIRDMKKEREHLCNQLRLLIFEDFNKIDKGSLPDLLYDACFVIDSLGEQAVNEVRNWFCNFILEPYKKLFAPGQPEASFENTKRRFAWLRRTLKEFQDKYEHIFPTEWNLKPMIAYEFCRQTKLHIDNILSTQHNTIDVSIIIDILQHTIDFEHDLHKRFTNALNSGHPESMGNIDDLSSHAVSVDKKGNVKIEAGTKREIMEKYNDLVDDDKHNKKVYERIRGKTKMSAHIYRFKGCISECFEPYLKSYSESEERKIIEAIENVFSQGDKLETIDYSVYSSSLHLFKNIKGSFKRCISFSTSKALFDLHISFKNVFRHYSKLLRKFLPKLGTDSEKISLNDEVEVKCCFIINTCEYCLETIPGLHNQIYDKIDEQYKQKIDLNIAADTFRELMNQCITAIVSSLEAKCDQQYSSGMQKINWASFSGVQDTSTYFKNIGQLIQKRVIQFKGNLHSVYFTYLLNKIASAVPNQYLSQVYKIKKVNDESSQQFLLDLVEMKSTLMNLPLLQAEGLQQLQQTLKVPESYSNFVNKNIAKLESRFKVIGYPIEQIKDAYSTLVKDKSQEDLELILTIRGVKKSDFTQYKLNM